MRGCPVRWRSNLVSPVLLTPMQSEADPTRCVPLSLQLFLQLSEEAPVGALDDELLGLLVIIPTSCRPRA
jgi:hypothetical protein